MDYRPIKRRCQRNDGNVLKGNKMATIDELIENFSILDDWEDKYQYLIELGEKLSPLDEKFKTDEFKVSGCQSQVWLVPEYNGDILNFHADSDAIMVKGIIAVLMAIYANKSVQEIKKIEVEDFFVKLGLGDHLSPSRRNGMMSMVDKIRFYANNFK